MANLACPQQQPSCNMSLLKPDMDARLFAFLCTTIATILLQSLMIRHNQGQATYFLLASWQCTLTLQFTSADTCTRCSTSGHSCIHSSGHHLLCSAGGHSATVHTCRGAISSGCCDGHPAKNLQRQSLPHQHPGRLSVV